MYAPRSPDRPWDEKEIERARTLKADGLSMWEIGDALGRTKNSVIGKLYRHSLECPQTPQKRSHTHETPRKASLPSKLLSGPPVAFF